MFLAYSKIPHNCKIPQNLFVIMQYKLLHFFVHLDFRCSSIISINIVIMLIIIIYLLQNTNDIIRSTERRLGKMWPVVSLGKLCRWHFKDLQGSVYVLLSFSTSQQSELTYMYTSPDTRISQVKLNQLCFLFLVQHSCHCASATVLI